MKKIHYLHRSTTLVLQINNPYLQKRIKDEAKRNEILFKSISIALQERKNIFISRYEKDRKLSREERDMSIGTIMKTMTMKFSSPRKSLGFEKGLAKIYTLNLFIKFQGIKQRLKST